MKMLVTEIAMELSVTEANLIIRAAEMALDVNGGTDLAAELKRTKLMMEQRVKLAQRLGHEATFTDAISVDVIHQITLGLNVLEEMIAEEGADTTTPAAERDALPELIAGLEKAMRLTRA